MKKLITTALISVLLLTGLIPLATPVSAAAATETLRPTSTVDNEWSPYSNSYTYVDDVTPDDGSTTIKQAHDLSTILNESWHFEDTSGSGVITSLEVHYRAGTYDATADYGRIYGYVTISSVDYDIGYVYVASSQVDTWEFTDKEIILTENPATEVAWTFADIDSLIVGVHNTYSYPGDKYVTQMYLEVNYTEITAPAITANAASNVGQTSARLNSTVTEDGSEDCEVRFGYGDETQTAGNFDSYDTTTSWVDGFTTGEHPYVDISDLTIDDGYFYRVQIRNDLSTVTSDEVEFATEASLVVAAIFQGIPSSTTVSLNWSKGVGAENTMIRFSYTDYPADETDGSQLYFGTGTNATHSDLTPGSNVYYAAFSESAGVYSSGIELLVTTLAGSSSGVDLTTPIEPANWFIDIDYTTVENLEPIYSAVNDAADDISVPRETAWFLLSIFVAVLVGFGFYSINNNNSLLVGAIASTAVLIIASSLYLVPGFVIFITGLALIAVGFNSQRGIS